MDNSQAAAARDLVADHIEVPAPLRALRTNEQQSVPPVLPGTRSTWTAFSGPPAIETNSVPEVPRTVTSGLALPHRHSDTTPSIRAPARCIAWTSSAGTCRVVDRDARLTLSTNQTKFHLKAVSHNAGHHCRALARPIKPRHSHRANQPPQSMRAPHNEPLSDSGPQIAPDNTSAEDLADLASETADLSQFKLSLRE